MEDFHMEKAIKTTETIELLFENYKASYNEETPQTAGQSATLNQLNHLLESLDYQNPELAKLAQDFWNSSVMYSRESEKAGFILGFKMAMNLMSECLG